MSFESLESEKIIVKEEGVFSYSFTAYDEIKAGQAVGVKGEGSPYALVGPTDDKEDFVGVAIYDVESGQKCAIAATGKMYGRAAASGISAGDMVEPTTDGKFAKTTTVQDAVGIALEDIDEADKPIKVLIK
jgi:predicted RecA/RadA family phage recombinase